MSSLVERAKNAAIAVSLNKALQYLDKDPEANMVKIMNLVDKVSPEGWYVPQRNAFRKVIINGYTPRESLLSYNKIINSEITRKNNELERRAAKSKERG